MTRPRRLTPRPRSLGRDAARAQPVPAAQRREDQRRRDPPARLGARVPRGRGREDPAHRLQDRLHRRVAPFADRGEQVPARLASAITSSSGETGIGRACGMRGVAPEARELGAVVPGSGGAPRRGEPRDGPRTDAVPSASCGPRACAAIPGCTSRDDATPARMPCRSAQSRSRSRETAPFDPRGAPASKW